MVSIMDDYKNVRVKKKACRYITLKRICMVIVVSVIVYAGSYAANTYYNLKNEIIELKFEIVRLESLLDQSEKFYESLSEKIFKKSALRVKITAYHPASGGTNSDSDPDNTATMTKPISGKTVAISTKLIEEGWLGKEIYVEGYGIFIANDRLAKGIPGYQIDICVSSKQKAYKIGSSHNVLAALIDREKITNFKGGK